MSDGQAQADSVPKFLRIGEIPVYFEEDWATGIGGGLWSTGSAMAKYLQTTHAKQQLEKFYAQNRMRQLNVLELGSGNGLLAACWMALGRHRIKNMVVTDLQDHLPLIERTMNANPHLRESNIPLTTTHVHIMEHNWGVFSGSSPLENLISSTPQKSFDIIVGSDVAYHPNLYSPLLASLDHFAGPQTVILLGITMCDTTPEFFDLLREKGFIYQRLADHLLDSQYRGKTFGIFVVQRKQRR